MRKRTARKLRRIADRLDPKPARWYQVGTQTQSFAKTYTVASIRQPADSISYSSGVFTGQPKGRRVLADYLSSMDLKKLRP
jgi:hypothetical protein